MNSFLSRTLSLAARRRKSPLWFVGGPVRDELLGRACDDWDMACRKAKVIAQEVARKLHAKFIALDEQNRIYRVILPESFRPLRTLDFAELCGRTIEEDLGRRDFTINAMARAFPKGEIVDPSGGRRDLRKKTVRAVSEKAFREDPLRLLRAFRFGAQFQFTLEPRTFRAIKKHAARLSSVAAERVREELLRLLKQPDSGAALRRMDSARLLAQIFPEMEACRRTAVRYYGKGGVLKHSLETVENLDWILRRIEEERRKAKNEKPDLKRERRLSDSPLASRFSLFSYPFGVRLSEYLHTSVGGYPRYAWLKLAAFLHDVGKPATAKVIKGRLRFFEHEHAGASMATRIGQRLRCSRQEVQFLSLWVRNHMRPGNLAAAARLTDKALSRFFRDLGEDGVGMVLVSLADHYTYLAKASWGKGRDAVEKISRRLLTSYYEERSKILPARLVNGHDLMRRLKLKPGPWIGQLLEKIQDAQAEGKVTTRTEALAFAKKGFSRRHPGRS